MGVVVGGLESKKFQRMADVAASRSVVARDIIDSTQLRHQVHNSVNLGLSV